jgi:tetratricopeptide (TPR) repeat protein
LLAPAVLGRHIIRLILLLGGCAMKAPQLGRVCLLPTFCAFLAFVPGASAQRVSGRNIQGVDTNRIPDPTTLPESMGTASFISGKVALDDGTEPPEPVAIQTVCRGNRRTRTYTDRHGNFTFQLGNTGPGSGGEMNDASNATINQGMSRGEQRNWRDCQLQAVLAGFSSDLVELASRMNMLQSADLGRLVLHRLEHVDGNSISVTSALAPSGARKALEKGREAEKKSNWDQAARNLEKAVQIYPKYAIAWFELGRVQVARNDSTAAKLSFQRSLSADPKYMPPYQGLAELAFTAKQWPDVVHTTEQMLALNPAGFPVAYFFNAVANYYLPNLDAAEKSAREGIKVDSQHEIAKLQYVLGMILLQKHDYQQAADYFHQYMRLTDESKGLEAANQQLAEIAKLSAAASSPKQ